MLFSLPVAVLINLCGTIIMLTIPYCIGRKAGGTAVNYVREKYPKVQEVQSMRVKSDLFFAFLVRVCRIPSDVASLYMGSVNVVYKEYLFGSLLGLLPPMITYSIMGTSVSDIRSPKFLIALGIEILYAIATTVFYGIYRKKNNKGNK